ncbi:hypothetical protein DVH24_027477 [Malus domestica]|uniref:Ubiquitin carboxyl-terminal hydrolase n=1 Tax=Malus domestica TaxID=3750 RepID=A0A498HDH9_MALDO|nr:hypothetical protein DVH24_027477 [Malus domestica]
MLNVSVKWQKELLKAVEIDTTQPPYVFKCQLYDLTGVPPERQKIMVKGGLLKDDADWSTLGVKEGQKLMMMGTADEVVKAPEKAIVFAEDLPEEEQALNLGYGAGLFNLGNTCYMNSTIQCLHSVPELKSALIKYSHSGRSNDVDQTSHMLTIATRDLFSELDKSVKAVAPMQFWMVLRKKYPQFGQQHNSTFMQQDAEECWSQLLYTLSQSLRSLGSSESPDSVKALFGIELVSRVHCVESGEESSETESVYSLKCHISHEVNHLHEGLKHGLKSELEKNSPSLGRSAIYVKESLINGLPRYLTIQFVRFFWKRESNQKAKILRKVDYPLQLDIFDLCSADLRKTLEAPRQRLRDEEGKKLGLKPSEKSSDSKDKDIKMSDAEGSSNGSGESSNPTPDEGAMTGIYDLVAVLTHKGRSADSGHYVAWVKQESGKWIQYDDDNPYPQEEEDITKLSGGGRIAGISFLANLYSSMNFTKGCYVIGIWPISACTRPRADDGRVDDLSEVEGENLHYKLVGVTFQILDTRRKNSNNLARILSIKLLDIRIPSLSERMHTELMNTARGDLSIADYLDKINVLDDNLALSGPPRHNAFSLPSDVDTFAFVAVCGGSIGRHGGSSRGSNFSDSASGGVATFSSSGSLCRNSSANFTGLLGPAPGPTQGFSNGFLLLGVLNAKFVNGLVTRVLFQSSRRVICIAVSLWKIGM